MSGLRGEVKLFKPILLPPLWRQQVGPLQQNVNFFQGVTVIKLFILRHLLSNRISQYLSEVSFI